jgi:glycosyltransferase involved in cell wall biosynthesis
MASSPKVSVLIPTFNRVRLIGDAVDSVLAQTLHDFEIIVVDDGSTDDTAPWIRERYGSEGRVRYAHQENRGIGAARQHGLRLARGEYISLLDDDDYYLPRYLESQAAFLDRHEGVDVVVCDARLDAETRDPIPSIFRLPGWRPPVSLDAMARGAWALPVTMTMRAGCVRALGFPSEFRHAEDIDFLWRLLAAGGRLALNDELLAVYRWHEGEGSRPMQSRAGLPCLLDRLGVAQRYAPLTRKRRHMLGHAHRRVALALVDERRWREARPHLWRWWRYKPDSSRALRLLARSFFVQ